jgi:hypothetical protein
MFEGLKSSLLFASGLSCFSSDLRGVRASEVAGEKVKFKMGPVLEMFTILDVRFEGRRLAKIRLRAKQLTCLFLILTSVLLGFSFLPRASATMQVPSLSEVIGYVGDNVTLSGNLTTTNGPYNVTFGGAVVAVGTATGNNVTASFLVPEVAAGNHTVTVFDVNASETTTPENFTVSPAYYLNVTNVPPAPLQFQEGDSVSILFNVTGGAHDSTFNVTIGVQNPHNSSISVLGVPTSSLGSGLVTLSYPGNFSGGANTDFVGKYVVSNNLNSASAPVVVGLTNSTLYHRMETVNIRAGAYGSNETVMLNVTGSSVQYSVNLTADSAGGIDYSGFAVPVNASVGSYAVSLASVAASPTVKNVLDAQNFTVPGFALNVTARNLAGEPVPNVAFEAFENGTSVANQTTDSNGLAVLMLEVGNYVLDGFSQGVEVGEGSFVVSNTMASGFVLNLTDLNVKVVALVNGSEVGIPEAGVYLTPQNMTLTTDITGNVVEQSLLPNVTYTLNASRYGTPFNVTSFIESSSNTAVNGTILNLLVNGSLVPSFSVTIACPSYVLQVQVFKADGQVFGNATVEAHELVGGINYVGTLIRMAWLRFTMQLSASIM